MLDYCIFITTYNRQKNLLDLLNQINNMTINKKIKIIIIDDCSDTIYEPQDEDVFIFRMSSNQGKEKFYKIIDLSFKIIGKIESKYYFYLQDDVTLKENYFEKSIEIFESIQDNNKIVLSTLIYENQKGVKKWTGFDPIEMDNVVLCQWVELFFICKFNFFEILNFKIEKINEDRWVKNPLLSSGVGEQMSKRLFFENKNMYVVKNSLIIANNQNSLMNPKEREINKLIAL